MANEQQPQQINLTMSEGAVFADGVGTALRIKALANPKGGVEKEGMIEVLFIDSIRQKVVSSVVVSRLTAKDIIINLNQSLISFDKEMASKDMPKPAEIKTSKTQPAGIR